MLALRNALATGTLPTFGPEASLGNFHHGALSRDILLPAAWLGGGDPVWVVAEVALLSLILIPICWWIARSIAGPAAGLTAALLAAVSASLIGFATFIWNPTPVEPGAAVAYLGTWQALNSRKARWWVVAAAGAALAAQAHIAAAVIFLPLAGAYALDLIRSPAGRRRSIVAWGAAGVALVVVTYLPLILYELSHNFSETRGILADFVAPTTTTVHDPLTRVLFAFIRILAWPLTRWPLIDLKPAFPIAFLAASGLAVGLVWRLGSTLPMRRRGSERPEGVRLPIEGSDQSDVAVAVVAPPAAAPTVPESADLSAERLGTWLVGLGLLVFILVLGLGLHSVSEVQALPTEQYHIVADPLVIVAAGIVAGSLWRSASARDLTLARRGTVMAILIALVAWNAAHWPPLTSPDGGWPAAQAAATRVERDAAGSSIAVVPLFAAKGIDAYAYPLVRDGVTLVAPDQARTVVLLCDLFWLTGCGGAAQDAWLAENGGASGLILVDRFAAAPDRTLSIYRRAP
jgi:hypothetical protein